MGSLLSGYTAIQDSYELIRVGLANPELLAACRCRRFRCRHGAGRSADGSIPSADVSTATFYFR